jgi:hypothetical protein
MARPNRPPLAPNAFDVLPIGAIAPRDWLRTQLRLSADGLTGRMMDIWGDVGPRSGWLGGDGENWERGPYYVRGLIALAHTLGDATLIEKARPWVEWTLASQRTDGFFGPLGNDDWWARMPMLEALRWHCDASGDPRVPAFLSRYFRYQLEHLAAKPLEFWGKPRGGDNLASVLWLYNRSGERFLLELADLLHRQTSDWIGELGGDGPPEETFDYGHGVNRAMGFKEPALWSQRSRQAADFAVLRHGWALLRRFHGQINGMYSGDEFLHGLGSTQGTEFCTIVEILSSFETALRIGGEGWIADAIERIAYNAMPAILSADHCTHQYFAQPNQVECSPGGRGFSVHHETDLLFGIATGYGCCAANFHMGWPRFAHHLWMATPDGGLAAMLLAPCEVEAEVRDGARVRIEEDTVYPFGDEVRFVVHCGEPTRFPLIVRLPGWAEVATFRLNQSEVETVRPAGDGERLRRFEREWREGDTLTLRLPMTLRTSRWERGSVGIERGPLVYALGIGEDWRAVAGKAPFADYEVRATTPWNYALVLDPARPADAIEVRPAPMAAQPWGRDGSPVRLAARARRVPGWTIENGSAGPIPQAPVQVAGPVETVELIPYGCARLRVSMFPICEK